MKITITKKECDNHNYPFNLQQILKNPGIYIPSSMIESRIVIQSNKNNFYIHEKQGIQEFVEKSWGHCAFKKLEEGSEIITVNFVT